MKLTNYTRVGAELQPISPLCHELFNSAGSFVWNLNKLYWASYIVELLRFKLRLVMKALIFCHALGTYFRGHTRCFACLNSNIYIQIKCIFSVLRNVSSAHNCYTLNHYNYSESTNYHYPRLSAHWAATKRHPDNIYQL